MPDERMWRLRKAAMRVLQGCGRWETLGGLRLMAAEWRDLKIIYRTPFQRQRCGFDPRTFMNGLALAQAEPDLAYVLEIWSLQRVPRAQWFQVLHLQWSDGEAQRRLVSYRSGDWEFPLMMLSAD